MRKDRARLIKIGRGDQPRDGRIKGVISGWRNPAIYLILHGRFSPQLEKKRCENIIPVGTLTPLVLVRIQVPQPNNFNDLAEIEPAKSAPCRSYVAVAAARSRFSASARAVDFRGELTRGFH
ncbi:hypothetical protein [Mesorhizobium sp. IMUNJ 23232]|uniref:hypothetical protein n=1 Tax=Mesorhizobium sp. IMUNJ 23232 TaxID=3376064 RepID=UPI003793D520